MDWIVMLIVLLIFIPVFFFNVSTQHPRGNFPFQEFWKIEITSQEEAWK